MSRFKAAYEKFKVAHEKGEAKNNKERQKFYNSIIKRIEYIIERDLGDGKNDEYIYCKCDTDDLRKALLNVKSNWNSIITHFKKENVILSIREYDNDEDLRCISMHWTYYILGELNYIIYPYFI